MSDQELPKRGGSYTRDEKGKLTQTQEPTKPAPIGKPPAPKSQPKKEA